MERYRLRSSRLRPYDNGDWVPFWEARDEIRQLEDIIGRNCDPRDVHLEDQDRVREIHQAWEPDCDCGDCILR